MDNPQLTPEQQSFIRKKQLFMAAMLQAQANGMDSYGQGTEDAFKILLVEFNNTNPMAEGISTVDHLVKTNGYLTMLFSHNFAKAFFGEGQVDEYGLNSVQRARSSYSGNWRAIYPAWQFYIMQLAATPERLEYLAPFIKQITPKNEWRK